MAPKPKFSVDDIPDLSGKVVIRAKAILLPNAKVYLACRNETKANAAIEKLPIYLPLDLASFKSIQVAANNFLSKEKELHILFNNAGGLEPDVAELTDEGYNLTIGVNVLGHFYFTKLLLPALLAVAQNSDGAIKARVVNTASVATELTSKLEYEAVKESPVRRKLGTEPLYYQSKFANLVYSTEFSRRYGQQIGPSCVNPGNLATELQRTFRGMKRFIIMYVGTCTEGATFNGKYFVPWARLWKPSPASQDIQTREQLWDWLEEEQVKDA
ncbi:NAD(P)-binding protein [Guyanagaster necrorhizus]|uniref:NAD(P)-binding protein n=1 Tax=Guyanagaster necrorhizus TaxID=856835 RepID=A0A9P7VKE0_9AGAR|nr:NAD(P)-binding protein [Guyanagaster necrorhizus MCA 3950]KAG7442329.1 NAD(P)-binding protein [Guyanagaster necrorhizus MCA 3950]